jgi:pimeloyl-ACP methyl ester carboxylesterase
MVLAGWLLLGLGSPMRAAADGPGGALEAEVRVALDARGDLDMAELVGALADWAGVAVERPATVRLPASGLPGALTRTMLGEALGEGASVDVEGRDLIVRLDARLRDPARRPEWSAKLRDLSAKAAREAARRGRFGLHALDSYRPDDPSRPTVCLIHGLNSSSGVFVHVVPQLERAGFGVVVYDYPDNQDLDVTAPRFAEEWRAFREMTGDARPWVILSHSMGGLIARHYVEGPAYRGDVSDLVLIGPPNQGAAVAKLQASLQVLDGLQAAGGQRLGALAALGDGLGESAADMLPGSPFLRELNGRPRREGVRYHILAGRSGFVSAEARREFEGRLALMTRAGGLLGRMGRLAVSPDLPAQLDELCEGTGDGCVAIASTRLDGAPDPVVIAANHVELIRGPLLFPDPGPVPCMPFVLEWLAPLLPKGEAR